MAEGTPTTPAPWAPRLANLLDRAGVTRVELDVFTKGTSFHGPEVSPGASAIAATAREEHLERGFGFWEFALKQTLTTDPATRRSLLAGALRHNTGAGIRLALTPAELARHASAGDLDGLPARVIISLCSTVTATDQDEAHLVMLDLGVRATTAGRKVAVDALAALGLEGALFTSGRSFHFYGSSLIAKEQLSSHLARAQLLSPIVDQRWISHQLLDGECRLRISTDRERNQHPIHFLQDI